MRRCRGAAALRRFVHRAWSQYTTQHAPLSAACLRTHTLARARVGRVAAFTTPPPLALPDRCCSKLEPLLGSHAADARIIRAEARREATEGRGQRAAMHQRRHAIALYRCAARFAHVLLPHRCACACGTGRFESARLSLLLARACYGGVSPLLCALALQGGAAAGAGGGARGAGGGVAGAAGRGGGEEEEGEEGWEEGEEGAPGGEAEGEQEG